MHETCVGSVCPGGLVQVIGVFYVGTLVALSGEHLILEPGGERALRFIDSGLGRDGEELSAGPIGKGGLRLPQYLDSLASVELVRLREQHMHAQRWGCPGEQRLIALSQAAP